MIPDLKIYHGRKIEKTYHAEEIDLQFGVVEDIIDALDLDSLQGNDAGAIIAAIVKAKNQIRPLLLDVFDGLTTEEARRTRMNNLVEVVSGIANYYLTEILHIRADEKN